MKKRFGSIFLFLAPLLFAACGKQGNVVKIGAVLPLTGDTGSEGQGLYRAIELAIEQVNASHRFPYKIEIAQFDDRADPKEAVNAANMVIADPKIVAVVGHYNSGCAIPAGKVYARAPIALITPAATNPEVTAQQTRPDWSGPQVVFRVCPTDDAQGNAAAEFIRKKLHKKHIAVISDKTAYGQGLAEEFAKSFQALGGSIASEDGISVGDKDFKALLTRLRSLNPDGVYFGGLYAEGGLIVRQMRELGMSTNFFSGDGTATLGFFDVAGNAADGAYLTMGGMPVELLPDAKDFVVQYKKRWNEPNEVMHPFDPYAYEAAEIILDALARVGPDRLKILEILRRTRHQGILGLTAFDSKGDSINRTVVMTRARASDRTFPVVRP